MVIGVQVTGWICRSPPESVLTTMKILNLRWSPVIVLIIEISVLGLTVRAVPVNQDGNRDNKNYVGDEN